MLVIVEGHLIETDHIESVDLHPLEEIGLMINYYKMRNMENHCWIFLGLEPISMEEKLKLIEKGTKIKDSLDSIIKNKQYDKISF